MSNSTRYPLSSTPASELSEQGPNNMLISNTTPSPSPSRQIRTSLQGPLAILWDIENCPVPNGVRPEDVAGNIRMALRVHPVIDGAITLFSAYGDFNAFPRRLREGCQRTGVKLVDVPNGRKDAADKAILVDMFLFALDNPPPSSIMLISGDVDFAPALHILGQRGYTVILVIPSNVGVSSALSNAGRFVWDWPSIVRGEGFVPLSRAPIPRAEIPKISLGCQMSCNMEGQNEEGSIVYRGVSKNYYNSRDFSIVSHSQSEFSSSSSTFTAQNPATSRSYSVPSGLSEVTFSQCDQNDLSWVQSGDLNVLKGQLVKLLEMSGGSLPLTRLPSDYKKTYGRPLYVSEFGALKLVHLLHKMSDEISVQGQGQKKIVCLCSNSKSVPVGPTVILARRDNRNGKGVQEGNVHGTGTGSSEEERAITNENGRDSRNIDQNVDKFKYELQEILVSYGCRILLGSFEEIYQQRYKRQLDYLSFGVNQLEELLEKVKDVVGLQEDETTRCKFLVVDRF